MARKALNFFSSCASVSVSSLGWEVCAYLGDGTGLLALHGLEDREDLTQLLDSVGIDLLCELLALHGVSTAAKGKSKRRSRTEYKTLDETIRTFFCDLGKTISLFLYSLRRWTLAWMLSWLALRRR